MKISLSALNSQNIKKGLNYVKYNGLSGVLSRVKYKMSGPGLAYNNWYRENHQVDEEEIVRQSETSFEYEPLISILVPVYMTPEFFLRAMIESVQRQTYSNWELCLVDGTRIVEKKAVEKEQSAYDKVYSLETERIIRQYMEEDSRIKYKLLEENLGISENTNKALAMAEGEYIALLDHDDILTEDALFSVVSELQYRAYDVLYSDEDKMSEDGSKFSDPAFKPDFNIDLLRAHNYITHFFVAKRELALNIGGFRREYDGAQDYDFILRCCEQAKSIKHIARVLYHWRINNRSVASNPHKKEYAKEAGKKALTDHIKRIGYYATVSHTEMWGIYKVLYETPGNPFISIIISGCDNEDNMKACLTPLFEKARYSNFEVIIADNKEADTTNTLCYRHLEAMRKNIRVISKPELKNKNALRNYAASVAKGDYFLFIDNNITIDDVNSIGEMLGICMRPEVGMVAGNVYVDNNVLCNGGIVLGVNGLYSYAYQGLKKNDFGYLMHNRVNCDYTAASASCVIIKKNVFDAVRGFDESYESELGDIDFCLKVREQDRLIVVAADAAWSMIKKSSNEMNLDTSVSNSQAKIEEKMFKSKWQKCYDVPDPFYNPNFNLEKEPFEL